MLFNFIFLECTFWDHLPLALALCLLPFLLGWLAAQAYYRVGELKAKITDLTAANSDLTGKLDVSHTENTELKVKITQLESELNDKNMLISKLRSDLMICEGERNSMSSQLAAGLAAGAIAGAAAKPSHPASVTFAGKKYKWDDLKIVEGIGPKIEELFHAAGIKTWAELAASAADHLKEILHAAGPNFQIHDPGSWPHQADLAAKGEWDILKKLQDELDGGK